MANKTKGKKKCVGCGRMSADHPMVAVMANAKGNGFHAKDVCGQCWADPQSRKNPIKGHFFAAADAAMAVKCAGGSMIGGPPKPISGRKGG